MHKNKYSQTDLIEGIRAHDAGTLDYLYSDFYPGIRKMVLANSGTVDDAMDIFQEALVILYRKLKEENFMLSCSVYTYLYAIARHMWLNQLKKSMRISQLRSENDISLPDDPSILDEIERNDRLRLYRRKFEELSEDCKRVLSLFLKNLPVGEITQKMGYRSDQHTKNRRFRCKMSLIKRIKSSKTYSELIHENRKEYSGIPRW